MIGSESRSEGGRPELAIEAIVALGCRVRLDREGLAPGALARRLDATARAYAQHAASGAIVVASGGRRWGTHVEADVMARELVRLGVPPSAVVRERCSLSTRDNARFTAAVLARRGAGRAAIVTCSWHMPRALALFSSAGVDAVAIVADDGVIAPHSVRLWRWGREWVLTRALHEAPPLQVR